RQQSLESDTPRSFQQNDLVAAQPAREAIIRLERVALANEPVTQLVRVRVERRDELARRDDQVHITGRHLGSRLIVQSRALRTQLAHRAEDRDTTAPARQ